MSTAAPQPQFAPPAYPPPPPPRSSGSGCWLGIALGCLGIVVVSIVLCAGGVWWAKNNAGKLVANIARQAIVAGIEASELDAQEKKEVTAQIDRVVNAYASGKLTNDELQKLMQELEDSPVLMLIQIFGIEKTYLEPSGLTAEEKQAGKRTIQRVFRGIFDKKIEANQMQELMPQSMKDRMQGDKSGGAKPTDDELKEYLAKLKKLADDAEIPDEDFKIDVSDELKKDIDKVLVGKE